ncbi:MAG: SapC family protein [Magnetococcus sp. YQC-5]
MPELLFYQQPVALNKEIHRNLKIGTQPVNFNFAASTNSVMLAGGEFSEAAKEYPILFVRVGERIAPVALLGFRDAENLFVSQDGTWDARYIPAFVRCYPFVLASGGNAAGEMTVCIDAAFSGFTTTGEGAALMDEQGEPTQVLQNAIKFLQEFQNQVRRTEIFVNRLNDMELFVEMTAQSELGNGQRFAMQGLLAVDEKKLLELNKTKGLELFRSGELSWVYAHLLSLSNIGRLGDRLTRRMV